jgi:hypothetical protein
LTGLSLSIDANIADTVDLFGKAASDLQENIVIGNSAITGTLKYVDDYSAAFGSGELGSGNYLALHITAAAGNAAADAITVEIVNGVSGPVTLDEDGLYVGRIADKSTQTLKVVASKTGYASVTKTYSLTGLTLADS